jgi:predicted aldo/keto reductase-like oxidoreductase
MEKRINKNSSSKNLGGISLLGFGFMRLPLVKEGSQEIDKKKAFEMVDYALDKGVNYFDTAYMYHDGLSEIFAGEVLTRHNRDSYYLATKMPLMFIKTEADVERIFNEQLKKCKAEYFDFYLLHNISRSHLEAAESCKAYEQLLRKKEQGLIRHLGFSFHDRPDLLEEVTERYSWDFAQIQLNYLDWELQQAGEQYEILERKGIPVNVMEPVRGGTLAKLCDKSAEIYKAANPHVSMASWAIRYAASLPGVQTVLSGMTVMEQVVDNVSTMEHFKPLTVEERAVIEKALTAYKSSGSIPCTGCRYCLESGESSNADCPSGVDIPRVLAIYNNYLVNKENNNPMAGFLFDMEYKILGENKNASRCTGCGQCESRCPQHLKIPGLMEEISAFNEGRKTAAGPAGPHADLLKKE